VNVTTFYVTEVFVSLLRFFQPTESTGSLPRPWGFAAAAALQVPPSSPLGPRGSAPPGLASGAEGFCTQPRGAPDGAGGTGAISLPPSRNGRAIDTAGGTERGRRNHLSWSSPLSSPEGRESRWSFSRSPQGAGDLAAACEVQSSARN